MIVSRKLAEFIATVGYIGKIRFAQGTLGSLVAFPICYFIMDLVLSSQIIIPINGLSEQIQQVITIFVIEILCTIVLFGLGTYCTSIYISSMENKDPKEVVIDELVGQMLAIICVSPSVMLIYNIYVSQYFDPTILDTILLGVAPFMLFRIFDIMKPWPINWVDQKMKSALGVMADDILAAIFAITIQYVILFFIIDLLPVNR